MSLLFILAIGIFGISCKDGDHPGIQDYQAQQPYQPARAQPVNLDSLSTMLDPNHPEYINGPEGPLSPSSNKYCYQPSFDRIPKKRGVQQAAREMLATYYQSCLPLQESVPSNHRHLNHDGTDGLLTALEIDGQTNPKKRRKCLMNDKNECLRDENGQFIYAKDENGNYISESQSLRKVVDREKLVSSHYYLNILNERKKNGLYPKGTCQDMTLRPPVFGMGSQMYVSPDARRKATLDGILQNEELDIFHKGSGVVADGDESQHPVGIDCSGFYSVVMASQGLRIKKNVDAHYSTESIVSVINDDGNDSCLKRKEFKTTEEKLEPGDTMVFSGSHVLIVDSIQKGYEDDPFGINDVLKSKRNCDQLDFKDMKFSIIHSGGSLGGYGPTKLNMDYYQGLGDSHFLYKNIRLHARKLCKQKFLMKRDNKVYPVRPIKEFAIASHRTSEPGCVAPTAPIVKGQRGCIERCFE